MVTKMLKYPFYPFTTFDFLFEDLRKLLRLVERFDEFDQKTQSNYRGIFESLAASKMWQVLVERQFFLCLLNLCSQSAALSPTMVGIFRKVLRSYQTKYRAVGEYRLDRFILDNADLHSQLLPDLVSGRSEIFQENREFQRTRKFLIERGLIYWLLEQR